MRQFLWIGLGSAFGGMARYGVGLACARFHGESFPWSTWLVNISGSLLIGLLAGLEHADGRALLDAPMRQFLLVGVLGGFTTFSSFSLQTLELARGGDVVRAGANVVGTVTLCLLAVAQGHGLAQLANHARAA